MENVFSNLLSLKDAAGMWHLEESTLRKAIASNRFVENVDIKKFGKQWVIRKEAMERVYGFLDSRSFSIEEKIDDIKQEEIYCYIFECFNAYCRKYRETYKMVNKDFKKYNIIEFVNDCYDMLHLQSTNSTVKEIRARIKRGIYYA